MSAAADADRSTPMTDCFQHTIDETAARRKAANETIRRMREAIERSKQLLRESGEQLEPPGPDDDRPVSAAVESSGSGD